ncbi:MAG: DNA-processing protein DprA [Acidimicrobiales bacterium]
MALPSMPYPALPFAPPASQPLSEAEAACAAALASLPGMTPVRLTKILGGGSPVEAWTALRAGEHIADPDHRFCGAARRSCPDRVLSACREHGIAVLVHGRAGYPTALLGDPGAPAVLFALGDPSVTQGRDGVAVVGTRSATPYGCQVASELGRDLAGAGIVVISGLARGIDGAAHAGAVRAAPGAAPAAVVGTGLDVVYPTENRALWDALGTTGVIFSESPLGTGPRPRVFPARNRIIAGLARVVVVVESHRSGGALTTAEAAARRGITVCAVPGSVRSPASRGTNGLLVDGCVPVRDVDDVLVAVALAGRGRDMPAPLPRSGSLVAARGPVSRRRRTAGGRAVPETARERAASVVSAADAKVSAADAKVSAAVDAKVLAAVDDVPTSIETVLTRTGLRLPDVACACERLVDSGVLRSGDGWWART